MCTGTAIIKTIPKIINCGSLFSSRTCLKAQRLPEKYSGDRYYVHETLPLGSRTISPIQMTVKKWSPKVSFRALISTIHFLVPLTLAH